MAQKRRYGIGTQTFQDFIERNGVYVDKTSYVYKMAHAAGKYFFLSRPRRFGKSLLLDTIRCYFEGRRDLFRGLAIDAMETEWTVYPVIRIDLSNGKYYEKERLHGTLSGLLRDHEQRWNVEVHDEYNYDDRLKSIIQAAWRQTGRGVVVLVDEYDAPMLDSIDKPDLQDYIRERIRNLFSPLKSQSEYLRFVFLTGISKFSQLSVFSELNNLNVLTFDPEYEGVCGITEEELLTQLQPDIEWLTESLKFWGDIDYDGTVAQLKSMYDGYHFSRRMTDIYNPWSLFNAFEKGDIEKFWFSTGTPTSLIKLMRMRHFDLSGMERLEATLEQFDAPTERISDPVPVLFQSGYLTIKDIDRRKRSYILGFPNEEVRRGFASSLYLYYADGDWTGRNLMLKVFDDMRFGKATIEQLIDAIRQWYTMIPYSISNKNERHYQSLLYAVFVAIGADVTAETQTASGRMDMVLKMSDAIYIIELKYDKTAKQAVDQIIEKNYASLFANDCRPVYAVGLNIDSELRTISSWQVEPIHRE